MLSSISSLWLNIEWLLVCNFVSCLVIFEAGGNKKLKYPLHCMGCCWLALAIWICWMLQVSFDLAVQINEFWSSLLCVVFFFKLCAVFLFLRRPSCWEKVQLHHPWFNGRWGTPKSATRIGRWYLATRWWCCALSNSREEETEDADVSEVQRYLREQETQIDKAVTDKKIRLTAIAKRRQENKIGRVVRVQELVLDGEVHWDEE